MASSSSSMGARKGRSRRKSPAPKRRERVATPSPTRTTRKKTDTEETTETVWPEEDKRTCWERSIFVVALVLCSVLPSVLVVLFRMPYSREKDSLLASAFLSAFGFVLCKKLIPVVARANLRKGLFGRDINKKGTKAGQKPVPESLGLATGLVHIVCIVVFQQIHTHFFRPSTLLVDMDDSSSGAGGWGLRSLVARMAISPAPAKQPGMDDWTEKWLIQYNSALASVSLMVFLGFADDVLDIPWRTKLALPTVATLPIIAAYTGRTSVLVPIPLRGYLGCDLVDLGWVYQVFMLLVVVFCTNSINILAGLNGLEAGQTLVIAGAVLLFNCQKLASVADLPVMTPEHVGVRDAHLFSAYVVLPLIAVTAALLLFNYSPSRVFVGDTYTYFAGMALAVSGILGHFSETLLLFFFPQILNFVYSVPQLFKVVPCPRHRLPVHDPKTGLLYPSKRGDGGYNLNLVTLFLRLFGPCTERQLCNRILAFQFACCAGTFALRWALEGIYK